MELPECLVILILIRLPIASIPRCKSVCKSWYAILSNPEFVFADLFTIDPDDQILYKHFRNWTDEVFSLIYFNNPNHISETKQFPPVNGDTGYTEIAGCCNGIVLLKDDLRMCLWNPATEEIKVVPEFTLCRGSCCNVGLCFDATTGDFKVISVLCPAKRGFVYSLRSDSWRRLEQCPCYQSKYAFAMNSSSGMCHWFVSRLSGDRYEEAILSFDVNREVFKTTIVPYSRSGRDLEIDPYHGFFMLKDYVAMFRKERERGTNMYEIWAMLEVGVQKSWIRVMTIEPTVPFCKVLRLGTDGKIFLQTYGVSKDGTSKEGVVIFNRFTGKTSPFLMHKYKRPFRLATNYRKSQVRLGELSAGLQS